VLHSSFAFDLTVTAMYGSLITGGCVHVGTLAEMGTPAAGPLGADRPTFVKVTPSHLALLTALPAQASPSGELMAGGELLLGETVAAWRRTHPGARVINEYGPTETTVGCSTVVIEPDEPVPPGPLRSGSRCPASSSTCSTTTGTRCGRGVVGELYIAGPQVARGYLNRPELTAAKFLDNPFGAPGSRMYRSGDRVRPTEDGEFQFMGRVDNQAKIRGYRVELGEIESVLTRHPDVAHAAVLVRTRRTGGHTARRLLVPAHVDIDETALRKHLAESCRTTWCRTCWCRWPNCR
jgi:non-ribosomal peptide synthetase component F